MKICRLQHHTPIETALSEAGFKIDSVAKQRKKTVITVIRPGKNEGKLSPAAKKQAGAK